MSLDKLERSISVNNIAIGKRDRLLKLYDDPLFKEFVAQGYFKDEAVRLVHLFSDGTQSPEEQAVLTKEIYAIGALKTYLSNIVHQGNVAERENKALQNEIADIHAEKQQAALMGEDPDMDPEDAEDYAGGLGA